MKFKTIFKLLGIPSGKVNTAEKPTPDDLNKERSTSEEDDCDVVSGTVKSNDSVNSP